MFVLKEVLKEVTPRVVRRQGSPSSLYFVSIETDDDVRDKAIEEAGKREIKSIDKVILGINEREAGLPASSSLCSFRSCFSS